MTRRKKLAISVVAILALAAAGVVAVVSITPTMRSKFDQLREGMTYEECVAILGEPTGRTLVLHVDDKLTGPLLSEPGWTGVWWRGHDGVISIGFSSIREPEDPLRQVVFLQFDQTESPAFLDRLRSWFGL